MLLPSWNLLTTPTHSNQNRSQSKIKHKSNFIEVLIILKNQTLKKKISSIVTVFEGFFSVGLAE